jgi:hypothetical protein
VNQWILVGLSRSQGFCWNVGHWWVKDGNKVEARLHGRSVHVLTLIIYSLNSISCERLSTFPCLTWFARYRVMQFSQLWECRHWEFNQFRPGELCNLRPCKLVTEAGLVWASQYMTRIYAIGLRGDHHVFLFIRSSTALYDLIWSCMCTLCHSCHWAFANCRLLCATEWRTSEWIFSLHTLIKGTFPCSLPLLEWPIYEPCKPYEVIHENRRNMYSNTLPCFWKVLVTSGTLESYGKISLTMASYHYWELAELNCQAGFGPTSLV